MDAGHMNSALAGLTGIEAQARLLRGGPNELPRAGHRSTVRIDFGTIREPMFALPLGAGALYFVLGDPAEAALLVVLACLSVGIAVVQEAPAERALEALRDLSSPRALVLRDGQRRRISGREVVADDLLVRAEGDRVPADGVLLEATALEADESLLTRESVPVRKKAAPSGAAVGDDRRPGGDDLPFVSTVRCQGPGRTSRLGQRRWQRSRPRGSAASVGA